MKNEHIEEYHALKLDKDAEVKAQLTKLQAKDQEIAKLREEHRLKQQSLVDEFRES